MKSDTILLLAAAGGLYLMTRKTTPLAPSVPMSGGYGRSYPSPDFVSYVPPNLGVAVGDKAAAQVEAWANAADSIVGVGTKIWDGISGILGTVG